MVDYRRRNVLKGIASGIGLAGLSVLEAGCGGTASLMYHLVFGDPSASVTLNSYLDKISPYTYCDPGKNRPLSDVVDSFQGVLGDAPQQGSAYPSPTTDASDSIDRLFSNIVVVTQAQMPVLMPSVLYRAMEGTLDDELRKLHQKLPLRLGGFGNGVLLTPDGWGITNFHVIEDREYHDYSALLLAREDGSLSTARIVAYSKQYDLALFKADYPDLFSAAVPVTLYRGRDLDEGTPLFNLGRVVLPDNLSVHLSGTELRVGGVGGPAFERYVSAGRFLRQYADAIVVGAAGHLLSKPVITDGFSTGGYSGSPLVLADSRLIGIVSMGATGGQITLASPASAIDGLIRFYIDEVKKREQERLVSGGTVR